jgi:hypothetical protein
MADGVDLNHEGQESIVVLFYGIDSTFRELVNAREDAENLIHISTLYGPNYRFIEESKL